ncbi:hypothetical protein BRE01_63120 [Brevibacillus reuszeri]|uniref:Small CPxCG-related zinc finger protein n=1 Tax=Brevibacillus reuszeri TaxID=54915 RepID=A0ABQ0TXP4_9BACL|nr:hypothetical protein [Brevibacillus reuszeri]MED1861830.1 hypothetical protein [Brevibacillus reuszeri]GED72610.1 hypothetical protein BRE01_63120 [Brevibacillus reuszeri]
MSKTQLAECPHCGSDEGYYTKTQVSGSVRYHGGFDRSERENGDMYEHLSHKSGKVAYCSACDKRLFKLY